MAPMALARGGATSRHALAIRAPAISTRSKAFVARPTRVLAPQIRVQSRSSDGFLTGFVVGGVVFGALGFLFAPQISKALLGDDQKLKLPRFLDEEEKDPEATKQDLIEKIAQLNASIDEVASQLKPKEEAAAVVEGETLKIST